MSIRNGIYIALVGVLVILTSQNTAPVTMKFLFWDLTLPLIILVYSLLVVGFIAGRFFRSFGSSKDRKSPSNKEKTQETIDEGTDESVGKKSLFRRKKG